MSDINEQEPSSIIGEFNKALYCEVSQAERGSKIDITPAETEEMSANKSPSCEINAEDDLKTTTLNLSKKIQELQQKRSSISFQHRRFYSNPDPMKLENDLPKNCHSHSQNIKRLKFHAYTKKIKRYSNFCPLLSYNF